MSARYSIVIDSSAPPWAQRMGVELNRVFAQIGTDLQPKSVNKTNLPTNGSQTVAIVPDEVGGSVLAFFDGTNWRRVTDRNVVS